MSIATACVGVPALLGALRWGLPIPPLSPLAAHTEGRAGLWLTYPCPPTLPCRLRRTPTAAVPSRPRWTGSASAKSCSCCKGAERWAPTKAACSKRSRKRASRPDWVIGTSIGAINAALIAGNLPEQRLERLTEFWSGIRQTGLAGWMGAVPFAGAALGTAVTVAGGLPGFFEPNPAAWFGANWPLGPEAAGYYSCAPLLCTPA